MSRKLLLAHNLPFMARKWQKTAIFSCNFDLFLAVFIECDHIYVPNRLSGPFWTVSNKNWYFALKHLCQPLLCPFGAKKSFLSKMVQKGPDGPKMGPKWSKTFRLTILVPFGPFWTTLECWQACHVWPFLVQNGPFLGHPQSWTVDPRVKKRLIIMSPMCGLLVEPQICPFET